MSTKTIATEYFQQNPDAKDGVMKAYHAYHVSHFRDEPDAHNFPGGSRESECQWCGRSRETVRHDDLPAQCNSRPLLLDIKECIKGEEERAFMILDSAAATVPKLVAKMGMSGATLAVLHHTHGYDPETVAGCVEVPTALMVDYHVAMETERNRSRDAHRPQIVAVKH